jgi:hypothetical protein
MGLDRRQLSADGLLGGDLGLGICLDQFDAAGAAGRCGAGAGVGIGVAQHFGALYRAAVGSAIGGVLYARDLLYDAGYASVVFIALALVTLITTRGFSKTQNQ